MPLPRAFDMEALMMSPLVAILALLAWIVLGFRLVRVGLPLGTLYPLLVVMTALNLVYCGILVFTVVSQAKTGVLSYLGLILATYPYAALISAANMVGIVSVGLMGRKMWLKTEKTGFVDQPVLVPA